MGLIILFVYIAGVLIFDAIARKIMGDHTTKYHTDSIAILAVLWPVTVPFAICVFIYLRFSRLGGPF